MSTVTRSRKVGDWHEENGDENAVGARLYIYRATQENLSRHRSARQVLLTFCRLVGVARADRAEKLTLYSVVRTKVVYTYHSRSKYAINIRIT